MCLPKNGQVSRTGGIFIPPKQVRALSHLVNMASFKNRRDPHPSEGTLSSGFFSFKNRRDLHPSEVGLAVWGLPLALFQEPEGSSSLRRCGSSSATGASIRFQEPEGSSSLRSDHSPHGCDCVRSVSRTGGILIPPKLRSTLGIHEPIDVSRTGGILIPPKQGYQGQGLISVQISRTGGILIPPKMPGLEGQTNTYTIVSITGGIFIPPKTF